MIVKQLLGPALYFWWRLGSQLDLLLDNRAKHIVIFGCPRGGTSLTLQFGCPLHRRISLRDFEMDAVRSAG